MMNMLYQVTGPTFSAGLVVNSSGLVLRAAPLLHIWEGRHIKDVLDWVHRAPPGRYHIRLVGPDPYQTLTPGQAIFNVGRQHPPHPRSPRSAPGTPEAPQ